MNLYKLLLVYICIMHYAIQKGFIKKIWKLEIQKKKYQIKCHLICLFQISIYYINHEINQNDET